MSEEIALAIRDNQIANLRRKLIELENEMIVLIAQNVQLTKEVEDLKANHNVK